MHSHPAAIPFRYVAIRHHRLLLQLERFFPAPSSRRPNSLRVSGSGCTVPVTARSPTARYDARFNRPVGLERGSREVLFFA
jgi:hypothetical protein